jgi:hypothetical protein
MTDMSNVFAWIALGYIALMYLLAVGRKRPKAVATLHDPISALLAAIGPEVLGGVGADVAGDAALAASDAALTGGIALAPVDVTASALGAGDIAAGAAGAGAAGLEAADIADAGGAIGGVIQTPSLASPSALQTAANAAPANLAAQEAAFQQQEATDLANPLTVTPSTPQPITLPNVDVLAAAGQGGSTDLSSLLSGINAANTLGSLSGLDTVIPSAATSAIPQATLTAGAGVNGAGPPLNLPTLSPVGASNAGTDTVIPSSSPQALTPAQSPTLVSGGGITASAPGPAGAPPELPSVSPDLSAPLDATSTSGALSGTPGLTTPASPTAISTAGGDTVSGPVASASPATATPSTTGGTAALGDTGDYGAQASKLGVTGSVDTSNGTLGDSATATPTGSTAGATDVAGGGTAAKSGISSFLSDNKDLLTIGAAAAPLLGSLLMGNPLAALANEAQAATAPASPAAATALNTATGTAIPAATDALNLATNVGIPASIQGAADATANYQNVSGTQIPLATSEAGTALQLQSAENTGLLPPGIDAALTNALGTSEAGIASTYGNLGLAGSTSEAQDVAANNNQILGQVPSILTNLVNQGIQAGSASSTADNTATNAVSQELSGVNGILNAVAATTGAASGVTGASNAVTGASNAVTNAASTTANNDLAVASFDLLQDQELQQALANLSKALTSSTIAPATT